MMHGRFGGMLNQETIKPRNLSETLSRLGRYFIPFGYMIGLAVLFSVVSIWTQVTTPELTGQAADCFLVPTGASLFAGFGAPSETQSQQTTSNCYLATDDPSTLSFSRSLIYKAYILGGFEMADASTATNEQRIEGLFRLVLVMIGLFALGAILTGAT